MTTTATTTRKTETEPAQPPDRYGRIIQLSSRISTLGWLLAQGDWEGLPVTEDVEEHLRATGYWLHDLGREISHELYQDHLD